MALVGAWHVAPRRPARRQADLVQVVDGDLLDGGAAGAEHGVTKGVLARADVADLKALADHQQGATAILEGVVHSVGQLLQGQSGFSHRDQQRHLPVRVGQARGCGDVADLASHGLQDEHGVCGRGAAVLLVGVLDVEGPVASHRAVAGGVIDQLEGAVADVVVDGLGHAGSHQIQTALPGQFGDLLRRVHRVVAAVVEEKANVVRLEDLDHPLQVGLLARAELVAAGADGAGGGRGAQQGDLFCRLGRHVDQLFAQHSFDAVLPGVDGAEHIGHGQAGLDHPAQRGIDHRRGAARLGDDDISGLGHI